MFCISWRNPKSQHRDWGLNTYVEAVDRAVETAGAISGSPDVTMMGACSGGITSCAYAAWAAVVTGTVPPVPPVLPEPLVDVDVEPVPEHVPSAVPSRAAETAQAVTGANTGTEPDLVDVETCEGSHELLAVPSTATTTLHAFTGMTLSATGAVWLASLVGRSLASGEPASGMHMPLTTRPPRRRRHRR